MSQIFLKPGHVQPVWAGHPWIFAQGIAERRGKIEHGGEVLVFDAKGNEMGRGFYSEGSAITVRLFTRSVEESFDAKFLEKRFRSARARRLCMQLPDGQGARRTTGYRLFHGEGDGIPGLIVDAFDDVLILQLGSAGLAARRDSILDALEAVFSPRAILDRTSEKTAQADRFQAQTGLARGTLPDALRFEERGLRYALPLTLAQKTGFYFDQRPLRDRVESLAQGKQVLDTYSYVGPIGLAAARGGASSVLCVDSSAPALEVGRDLAQHNQLSVSFERSDSLQYLEKAEPVWDLVIADPPKLAQKRSGRLKAAQAFRRIAATSLRAVRPGGLLVLSSCSAALGFTEIERCLALGARDAGRTAFTLERIFQGADHPVPPAFSEGLYLSTLIAQIE